MREQEIVSHLGAVPQLLPPRTSVRRSDDWQKQASHILAVWTETRTQGLKALQDLQERLQTKAAQAYTDLTSEVSCRDFSLFCVQAHLKTAERLVR